MRDLTNGERWRHRFMMKHGHKMSGWIVRASTALARKRLAGNEPIKALVDNTVFYHAVTHETGWISTGPSTRGNSLPLATGYAARIPVHFNEPKSKTYRDVTYIAGLAHLHRTGLLGLFGSAELEDERFRQPQGRFSSYGYFDLTLLHPNELPSIDGFVFATLGPDWMGLPSAREQQLARLAKHEAQDARFGEFVRCLGAKHSQDAWHLRTGELTGCGYFLTMDYKLIRMIEKQSKRPPFDTLLCQPVSPETLGKKLGIVPLSPRLFSYDNASFPVRADLTMPEGKRIPLRRYKK